MAGGLDSAARGGPGVRGHRLEWKRRHHQFKRPLSMGNVDVYADIGVNCASSENTCDDNFSNTFYFSDQVVGPGNPPGLAMGANPLAGLNPFDPTALEAEMGAWETYILGLDADATITSNIENRNVNQDGIFVTDLNQIDLDGTTDGIAVIDIDIDNGNSDFEVTNSDWILQGDADVFAIFRIQGGSNFNLSQSSILLGNGGIGGSDNKDGVVTELGAIFYVDDPLESGNAVFNFNNVILNGIGFYDFTAITANGVDHGVTTYLVINDGQGCAQFISSQVVFNDVRFNRCALAAPAVPQTPDPPTTQRSRTHLPYSHRNRLRRPWLRHTQASQGGVAEEQEYTLDPGSPYSSVAIPTLVSLG